MARESGAAPMNSFLWGHSWKPSQGRWCLGGLLASKGDQWGRRIPRVPRFVDHSFFESNSALFRRFPLCNWLYRKLGLAVIPPPTRTLDGVLLQTDNKQRGDAASSQGLQLQGPSAFPYPSIPHPELRAQFSRPSSSLPYREVAPNPHSPLKP